MIYRVALFICVCWCEILDVMGFIAKIKKKNLSSNLSPYGKTLKSTVFSEFRSVVETSPLKEKIIDFGLGDPEWEPPDFVIDAAVNAVKEKKNLRYCRAQGSVELASLLAARYSNHLKSDLCYEKNIAVTGGASEGLYVILERFLQPGDEVVVFDPYFSLYIKQINDLGGIPRFVPLDWEPLLSDDDKGRWTFEYSSLKKVINKKTKFIILNSPHNPTGKVFTAEEIKQITDLMLEFPNTLLIHDEVYKYTIPSTDDISMLSTRHVVPTLIEPRIKHRTFTVSSAGKTFGVTGWSIGWVISHNIKMMERIHNFMPNLHLSIAAPLQIAIVEIMERAEKPYNSFPSYYKWLQNECSENQKHLARFLKSLNIQPRISEAGYFIIGDLKNVANLFLEEYITKTPHKNLDNFICTKTAFETRVVALPLSAFSSSSLFGKKDGNKLIRIACCKKKTEVFLATKRVLNHYKKTYS